jgi:hypothetical protein
MRRVASFGCNAMGYRETKKASIWEASILLSLPLESNQHFAFFIIRRKRQQDNNGKIATENKI